MRAFSIKRRLSRADHQSMRRILLLFPRLNNFVFFGVYEPLILEILSAIAKEEACAVELIDLRLERMVASGWRAPAMCRASSA